MTDKERVDNVCMALGGLMAEAKSTSFTKASGIYRAVDIIQEALGHDD